MTVNKDLTMVRNQRPSFNDRDENVYLAFLSMRQKQGTILVMLGYHALSRTRAIKRWNKIAHTHSCAIRWQEVIDINNVVKEAGINNLKIAR